MEQMLLGATHLQSLSIFANTWQFVFEFVRDVISSSQSSAPFFYFGIKDSCVPCTVLIDESGDTGVSVLRSEGQRGSSNYFTMGAAVFQPTTLMAARQLLERLQSEFRKTKPWRHATDLNHSQKVYFCRELTKLNVRFFGIMSNKNTLGEYAEEIAWEPDKFYNKCAKYLLERVGSYLTHFDKDLVEPQIVFEKRNHDYDAMIRYLAKVRKNPIYSQSNGLSTINPFGIISCTKEQEAALRVADMVSHALYACVNKAPENFGIVEPRYLKELSARFAADGAGKIIGTGLKFIHSASDMQFDKDLSDQLHGLRARPRPLS
jgi:hypothetical protein